MGVLTNGKRQGENGKLKAIIPEGKSEAIRLFFRQARNKTIDKFPEGEIGGGLGNFVRYAVAESATDAAERGQRVLAHFAEPRGGKACEAGLTYLGVCEHLRRK